MYYGCLFVIWAIINYTASQSYNNPQSDVGAPAYAPYVKSNKYSSYGGSKKSYSGTKTGRHGMKNGYSGTKTGPMRSYGGMHTGNFGYGQYRNMYGPTTPSYESFRDNAAVNPYQPVCNPDCKNNGICVAEGVCKCPDNYFGNYCEFEKIPCMTYPPTPMNAKKMCSSEMCTIQCLPGHQFIDGTSAANMRCESGSWKPTRADLTSIPDCVPICNPPCLNGGACLSLNICQCPSAYRGLQCQYSIKDCDHKKLGFNGIVSCSGDMDSFSCKLTCPPGTNYTIPPAELYTCLYSTGEYKPQPIPQCVFNEVESVVTNQHHTNSEHTQSGDTHSSYIHRYHSHTSGQTVTLIDNSPKKGTCFTWGGTHYKTFDGKVYSFHSTCQHILMRDKKDHKYTVAVSQGECKRQYYCPSKISVFMEDKQYFFSVGEEGGVVFRNTRRLLPIPVSLPGLRVSMPKDTVFIYLDGIGATVKWDTQNLIMIEASVSLWNNTEGLCGNLDGREETDFLTKDGDVALTTSAMASSWQLNKIGEACESTPTSRSACTGQTNEIVAKSQAFCTSLLQKKKFRKCSNVMDATPLLEACQWDYCTCAANQSPEDCACNTIAVYAQECLKSGVEEIKTWRDKDTCPMKCADGKIYKSCGPDTQPSCAMPNTVSVVDNTTCVEGCYCPDGLYLEEGLCIPKEECPCRLRTKIFKPSSVVPKDCNTCTCEAGEWKCTQASCGARCGAVGDPHYTTFDGLKYNFMGHCVYDLLRSDNITIEVENVACSGSISETMNLIPSGGPSGKPSCTKAVNIISGGTNVHLKQGGFILVNGKDISSLPVHIGEICIRTASSLFIIVELPNDVNVWWDGNTRVFVDVPPEFRDKTKGLCGTFNYNQKDDFLTPEGDIEQTALAFANKWKTREFCDDVLMTEPEHPCKTNVENKETAEKYCSKLKSKIFQECHWHVDVEPYYEECMYDVCACSGDVARCLCPILGDYAMACARNGIKIQWRYNVKECELKCDGGQEYTVCADSCQRTCSDVAIFSTSNRCKPTCVEGCACPPGQVLDAKSQCVPIGLCPCVYKGLEFQPGYKEVRPGRRERELCTCVGAKWDCRPATTVEIQKYPPAEDMRLNCSATLHLEFTTCETAEPLTCKNMHLPPSSTTAECRPGCQCQKGYVLDTTSKKCVIPTKCPCHHGGQSYPDGHIMQEECNTCTCKRGNWDCTSRKCVGVCSAWGDSHFTTFDGKEYDFEGVCTYLMAKGVMETGKDSFDVEIQNMPCGTTGATCSKSVTLKVRYGDIVESVSLSRDAPLPDTSQLKSIQLRKAGIFVFLDVPSLGMTLQWERAMRVYVKVDPMWENRLKGLCGNYNNDQRDDFQTPSGGGITESSALTFADSWKLKPTCPKPEEVKDHCQQRPERKEWAISTCGAMKRFPFTKCHTEVPPTDYITKCEKDACACDSGGDCECACTAIAAYAQACTSRGVEIRWRSESLCPMQCDEEDSLYESCITPCPVETCDNTLNYEQIKRSCARDTCVEGCKPKEPCPTGKVYSNSSHIECIPRTQCRPICMKLENGKEILEGEVIEEDACHACRCSQKQRVCTGVPCSTEPPVITTSTPSLSTVVPEETRKTVIPVFVTPGKPSDEPLKCVKGWTPWISRNKPETVGTANNESIEKEPLPLPKELEIGSPMCEKNMIKKIECRTVVGHKTPKETGFDAECSLENGLVCKEIGKFCPDFEIRVYCECEEKPFQCLDSVRPNHPHPSDCHKFYECTPDPMSPDHPHAILKTCGDDMMYNPQAMVCDWPASVIALKPECAERKESQTTTHAPEIPVSPTTSICPPGQVYSDCAYPCDKLCHNFLNTLQHTGKCTAGEKCVSGCMDERASKIKCDYGALWRDEHTCVPVKDCTCFSSQGVVKPNGVVIEGCEKCQCLDNKYHCHQTSECVVTSTVKNEYRIPVTIVSPTTISSSPLPTTITVSASTPANATTGTTITISTTSIPTQTTLEYTTLAPTQKPRTTTVTTAVPETTVLIIKTTVTPPPQCDPTRYKYLLWEEQEMPDSAFSASSMASELFAPQYAILNGHPMDVTAGSWNPATMDTNQYLQVELPRREPIYGVIMQGSPLFDQYVTSYEVLYGDDGNVFSTVNGPDNKPKIFRGPVDHDRIMKQMIEPPIEAKYIRIRPLTWHEEIAIRFELIGCKESLIASTTEKPTTEEYTNLEETSRLSFSRPSSPIISTEQFTTPSLSTQTPEPPLCTELMGLQAGLPVSKIEVSSNPEAAKYLSLKEKRGWRPLYSTPGEWILFDFTDLRNITGIKTKGDKNGWVESYNIMYATNLTTFNPLLENGQNKVFPANFDGNNEVMNMFRPPIHARYLKVLPLKWHNSIDMRIEPIGCFIPYSSEETEREEEEEEEEEQPRRRVWGRENLVRRCRLCPGVHLPSNVKCPCAPPQYYDGEGCTDRALCPCFVSFMPYAVGATVRGANCDECTCKLGGVPSCQPIKECKCAPDLVPKVSSLCECTCEPCPEGTRICPTSHMCLKLESWCDGLLDCPDDEVNCTTTTAYVTLTTTVHVETTVAPTVPTTAIITAVTTEAPKIEECPKPRCAPGYTAVGIKSPTASRPSRYTTTSGLPPPRQRKPYDRYRKGTKGGYGRSGHSKGGFTKSRYTNGGGGVKGPQNEFQQQQFDFARPVIDNTPLKNTTECKQFKCVRVPPYVGPGSTTPIPVCSAPKCPSNYALTMVATTDFSEPCPQYVCVPPPERPVFCNMTGRTFNTFDGSEYKYDICFHVLARGNRFNNWAVLVKKKCTVDLCENYLLVKQDRELITVKPNLMIEYDHYEYTYEQARMMCFQKNSFDISRIGNGLSITSRIYNITVLYYKNGDIKIGVFKDNLGSVDGLCGTFNQVPSDDRSLPNGTVVLSIDEFGKAWAARDVTDHTCHPKVVPPQEQIECWEACSVLIKSPLSKCAKVLNLDRWRGICLDEICKCAESEANSTQKSRERCRCALLERFVAECLAADKYVDLSSWHVDFNCPTECRPPLVHNDCFRKNCEPTCSSLGMVTNQCPVEDGLCFPGCYCPEGKLRKGDDCVPLTECRDCVCNGAGNSAKYVTFERDDLPFGGNCTYLVARDQNDAGNHNFEVFSTNGPCKGDTGVVCTKTVHLIYKKNILHVQKNVETNKLEVIINGEKVFKYPMKNEWSTITLVNKEDINIVVPDVYLEITVIHAKMEFVIRLPSYVYANKTEGLCGTCAGYSEDLVMKNGTTTESVDDYGNSWRASPEELKTLDVPQQDQCGERQRECLAPSADQDLCLNVFNAAKFGKCYPLVDPTSFAESCQDELCVNPNADLCKILERYATECRHAGVCLDWRSPDLCPYPCSGDYVYRPCVKCQPTCEDYEQLEADPDKCDNPISEGCYCPEGKVLVNNTCIEKNKCFPCDAEHYVGDEWQENACKKCSCTKPSNKTETYISCNVETCTKPICGVDENFIEKPLEFGACCKKYSCVPKPKENVTCEEPKQITCGFGQVLKQKTTSSGCKELVCECKPASECDPLPNPYDVETLEPGMERVIDESGCCPSARLECKPKLCPVPAECPALHETVIKNVTGMCCPQHSCEPPKNKCIVTLNWEAEAKGGEKPRTTPETVLKDLDSMWLDGPCRSCHCNLVAGLPTVSCTQTACPAIVSTDDIVMETVPVPFACCSRAVPVACRRGDDIYKAGENWTSPYDPCESYKCTETVDGALENRRTIQQCETDCQPGWKYTPADKENGVCCGKCKPFACIVDGAEKPIGTKWTSEDHCTNYTCVDVHGTLQVQRTNESCPEPSIVLRKQFVLNERKMAGKCCKVFEPVACRVGNAIYQEGQTWPTDNPCKNLTCGRDDSGQLALLESVERCETHCQLGWEYAPAASADKCCGRCHQVACVSDGQLKLIDSKWTSEDNCTTYECVNGTDSLLILSSQEPCPDVSGCAPEDRHVDGCCERCPIISGNQKVCAAEPIPAEKSIGFLKIHLGHHGVCTNKHPLKGFRECVGRCDSKTVYNSITGNHDSDCKCCQVLKNEPIVIQLNCADGTQQEHQVASPLECSCTACQGAAPGRYPTKTGPTKTGPTKDQHHTNDFPAIDPRFRENQGPF